ncbi:DUF362 domain-containing protein [Chloroflexota bacterium]
MPNIKKSKVALIKCDTYENGQVEKAVDEGINVLGGISNYVQNGERIVIKPNVLIGTDPNKCVCTHPSVFRAVGLILNKAKTVVTYGDSSGFGKCETNMKKAKLREVADELGMTQADFDKGQVIIHKDALLNKRFVIANGVLASDGLISIPKLKTHGLTRFTGAVKNQFGCVPGFRKGQFHVKLSDPYEFAKMLVDLNTLIKPRLYIMDGIMAMEGNGPRNGKPKKLGVLLFSTDPIAIDAIACKIINLNPVFVPTSKPGEIAGLGTYHYENIELVGEDIETFIDNDFEVVRRPPIAVSSGRLRTLVRNQICPKLTIDKTLCTNCGTCVNHCPVDPKAINWHTGNKSSQPTYKYDHCIRCFCCQELCPQGAISIKETTLSKAFFR